MRTGRRLRLISVLLLVFCVLLSGCSADNPESRTAQRLYLQGSFSEAEEYFGRAVTQNPGDRELRLAHAYNLIALGEYAGAMSELVDLQDAFGDEKLITAVNDAMIDVQMAMGNYAGAAKTCQDMSELLKNRAKADEYLLTAARIRADIYREQNDRDRLRTELDTIVRLDDYAGDAYYELYAMSMEDDEREARLRLADEIAAYMTGHNAYITDYCPLVSVMFDAAKVAGFTEWDRTPDDYFSLAEGFIARAEEAGLSADELLRYKIIIAERQGKMESAYRLLGVYLNHCSGDGDAQKEHDYLQIRFGFEDE